MNEERYQASLDVMELVGELKRLLLGQRRADHLICRYLADLADGMASRMDLRMIYRDVYELARATLGLSSRAIRERIRVGKALRELPLLDAALMSAEVTYSRIREVTRAATPETDRLWLEAARRLSMRALEQRVAEANGAARARSTADRGLRVDDTAGPGPRANDTADSEPRAGDTAGGRPGAGPGPGPHAGGTAGLRACGRGADDTSENLTQNVPAEVLALLKQALQLVRAGCDRELTDAEALAGVARAAILHLGGSLAAEGFSPDGMTRGGSPLSEGLADEMTHGGSPLSEGLADEMTHGGSPLSGEGLASEMTHSGSPLDDWLADEVTRGESATGRVEAPRRGSVGAARRERSEDKPLSADEQLLLELVRTGGYWNAPMLLETTAMPFERLVTALFDLQLKRLIIQGPMGTLEA